MVGVGAPPHESSALARVSVVNFHGHVLLDCFVRPKEKVTDWRTWVSGVRPEDMEQALTFEEAQAKVAELMKDRVLVGHAIKNDLEVLLVGHPKRDIRDTSRHPGFRKLAKGRTPALKKLAKELLGIEIQGGQHSSVSGSPRPGSLIWLLVANVRYRLRMRGHVCCCIGGTRTSLSVSTRRYGRQSQRIRGKRRNE